jgi:hypothetical protein
MLLVYSHKNQLSIWKLPMTVLLKFVHIIFLAVYIERFTKCYSIFQSATGLF